MFDKQVKEAYIYASVFFLNFWFALGNHVPGISISQFQTAAAIVHPEYSAKKKELLVFGCLLNCVGSLCGGTCLA